MGCGTSMQAKREVQSNGPNGSKSYPSRSENVCYSKESNHYVSCGFEGDAVNLSLHNGVLNNRNGVLASSGINTHVNSEPKGGKESRENICRTVDGDDFDILSSDGSRHDTPRSHHGQTSDDVAHFATFYNKPQECHFCKSPVVTHVCENCDNYYLCMNCMDERGNEHDKGHAISRLHGSHGNESQTFGAESSVGTLDCVNNSLFFDPCSICNRVILDTERVFHCEVCNFVECDGCHTQKVSVHEHELKPFQRSSRSGNVTGSAVVSKTRNSDGNKVINDYVVVKLLGKGSYAKVKLVQHRRTRKLYALKILRRNRMNSAKRTLMGKAGVDDDLLREVAVMKFVVHPNIVELNEVIDDTEAQKVYVIMEYCAGGPVHVLGDPPLPLDNVRKYGSDILSGLLHLHSEFLYHRDIKPANCLLSEQGVVKIADFGCCGSRLRSSYSDGTPAFNCPEQLTDSNVSGEIVDSWSFAMTLYQMAFGELAVNTSNRAELRHSLTSPEPFVIKETADPLLSDLLTGMLNKNLSCRLMLNDASKHPFWGTKQIRQPVTNEFASMSISHADMCERAMQVVQYGKRVANCFHGLRGLRRVRRRLAMQDRAPDKNHSSNADVDDALLNYEDIGDGILDGLKNDLGGDLNGENIHPNDDNSDIRELVHFRIKNMKKGVLNLSDLPLSEPLDFISDAAERTTNITLSSNGLRTRIPIDFTVFTELQGLTITENKLAEFPDEVLNIKRLRHLDLSFNRIANVSPRLPEAWRLEYLSLNSNRIRHVGVDSQGRSLFSGRCLRNVRLCDNPLDSLPEALLTCPNLNLVIDDAPNLVEEWGEKVVEVAQNVVVVWNDIYPRPVSKNSALYITTKSISLYKSSILEALKIQHAVLWRTESTLPLGRSSNEMMRDYIANSAFHTGHGKSKHRSGTEWRVSFESDSLSGSLADRGKVPPILSQSALMIIKSYFVVADSAEDSIGGIYPLVGYLVKCIEAGERVLVFFDEVRLPEEECQFIMGAMSQAMKRCLKDETKSVSECYEMIVEATKGIYS